MGEHPKAGNISDQEVVESFLASVAEEDGVVWQCFGSSGEPFLF